MNLIVSGTNGEITVMDKFLHVYDAVLRADQGLSWDQHITYWRVIAKTFLYESEKAYKDQRGGMLAEIVWVFDHQDGRDPKEEMIDKFYQNQVPGWDFTSVREAA